MTRLCNGPGITAVPTLVLTLVGALVLSISSLAWAQESASGQSAQPAAAQPAASTAAPSPQPAGASSAVGSAEGATSTPTESTKAGPASTTTSEAPKPDSAATSAAAQAGGAEPLSGPTYAVRLRDLEQRIDELKEQIRRSHTRLSLLSDTILSGGVGGSRAEIVLKNDLGDAFRMTGVMFVLDGAVQYNKEDDTGALASQKEIPIFSGSIPPGDHTVQVQLKVRGHGYGVFSYLRAYHFKQQATHSFTITEGKTVGLDVVAYEQGDATTPLEKRLATRFHERVRSGTATEAAQPVLPSSGAQPVGGKAKASGNISIGAGAK